MIDGKNPAYLKLAKVFKYHNSCNFFHITIQIKLSALLNTVIWLFQAFIVCF